MIIINDKLNEELPGGNVVQRFANFSHIRNDIFKELLKKKWNSSLNKKNLNIITKKILDRYNLNSDDAYYIKNHIRVAMGLNPTVDNYFANDIESGLIETPIVTKVDDICQECEREEVISCKYDAFIYNKTKGSQVIGDNCLGCGECIDKCDYGVFADKIEFIPLVDMLKSDRVLVFASVAPSIAGQFGNEVSNGQLRAAFKYLGFADMVEVALFADILTIKEAYEFDHLVRKEDDFFLTSCCCPIWVKMVERNYPEIFNHMSLAVSPMIASGRFIKQLYPEAKVVFVAPCTAKKVEARDPELEGDIDFVITFAELKNIFSALNIDLTNMNNDDKDQASYAGRIYGRTGGVSLSVKSVVNRIAPHRLINLKAKKVHGIKNCKEILNKLTEGRNINANFIEGMACLGGCVGGPATNIDKGEATRILNEQGEESLIMTPMDNLNVIKILNELGLSDYTDIVTDEKIRNLLKRDIRQTVQV